MYIHWIEAHMESHPFQFAVVEHMACYYCDVSGSNKEMFEHSTQDHPDETRIMITGNNGKCAFCPYDGDALIEHFEIEHDGFKLEDLKPIQFDDDTLNWLSHLQFDIQKMSEQKKTDHAATSDSVLAKVDHLICSCQAKVENYTDHIINHPLDVHCSKCSFETQDLIELVQHDGECHGLKSINFRCIQFAERLEKSYWNTKMVFKNGFVADMQQLEGTMFDNSEKFGEFVKVLVARKKNLYNQAMEIEIKTENVEKGRNEKETKTYETKDTASTWSEGSTKHSVDEQLELRRQRRQISRLFVHGVPFQKGENLVELFLKICKEIDANVHSKDIVNVYRPSKYKPIFIVECRDYNTALHILDQSMMAKKLFLRNVIKCSKSKWTMVVVIEWLTRPYFQHLMRKIRAAHQEQRIYSYRWTTDGILVQRSQNSRGKHVLNEREFYDYIN